MVCNPVFVIDAVDKCVSHHTSVTAKDPNLPAFERPTIFIALVDGTRLSGHFRHFNRDIRSFSRFALDGKKQDGSMEHLPDLTRAFLNFLLTRYLADVHRRFFFLRATSFCM